LKHQNKQRYSMTATAKIIWGFVAFAILWLAYFFWQRYNAIKRLQITPDFPYDWRLNGGFVTFKQRLNVNNADPVDLQINRLNMDVRMNDTYLGKASLPETQIVSPNSISAVYIQVTTTLTDLAVALGTTIYDLIRAKPFKLNYQGVIGGYGVVSPPINETLSVNPTEIFRAIFK
jgi:hypothetical protein